MRYCFSIKYPDGLVSGTSQGGTTQTIEQSVQVQKVIPDVGIELAKIITLQKEIIIWGRLDNSNMKTCRKHIKPQFMGNAIRTDPLEYRWIPLPHRIEQKPEPLLAMVSILDKKEFSLNIP